MPTRTRLTRAFLIFYLFGCGIFYYKYVPLAKAFQWVLLPVLLAVLILTALRVRSGLAFFIFAFPLINNLPYFFGIFEDTPHAPTALVLFLAFFLGWLIHRLRHPETSARPVPIFRPLLLFSCLVLVSAFLTFLRYANFFPFLSYQILDLIVNVNGVKAGGALMSVVFSSLNYLTGFLFFYILVGTLKSREHIQKLLIVLSLSTFLSLLFSFLQKFGSLRIGNTPFWFGMDQMNATFKDPNAFAAYLSAFFPFLLGLIFSLRKNSRLFLLILIALMILIFPWLGARSAFLAILVSMTVFLSLALVAVPKFRKKKYRLFLIGFCVFLVGVLISFALFGNSKLYQRLGWSMSVFSKKISWTDFLNQRRQFWDSAFDMTRDYPLTGVGVGAYIIELPNYAFLRHLPYFHTDSALNYAFQVGSEFGWLGLLAVFWLVIEIIRIIKRAWRETKEDLRSRLFLIGAISGLSSFFINFFFHTYIGSYEVKYFLWLVIASVCILIRPEAKEGLNPQANRRLIRATICLTLVFGMIHLWNSTHSLSLGARAAKLGWSQSFGLYETEKDPRGFSFQWAKKTSGIALENLGPALVIPMMASHPDIQNRPVRVRIFLADQNFRIVKFFQEVLLQTPGWTDIDCPLDQSIPKNIQLVFKTDRIWQPSKDLKMPDPRRLAVGLGKPWFRYPSDIPSERIQSYQKKSSDDWEGPEKKNLFSPGTSTMKFRVDQNNPALRIWAKGQKAFGVGPYLIISLDGSVIGKTQLDKEDWTSLILKPEIRVGDHVLGIEFTNDIRDSRRPQDRNVFLGDLEILYLKD